MVEQYLNNKYTRTHWPFFSLVEVINKFGEEGREELNKMFLEKKIRPRPGINKGLIELLK